MESVEKRQEIITDVAMDSVDTTILDRPMTEFLYINFIDLDNETAFNDAVDQSSTMLHKYYRSF